MRLFPSIGAYLMLGASAFAQTNDLPNLHKVDEKVYRGAQPTDEGLRKLAKMGIHTVVDLRGPEHSEVYEKGVVEAAGMHYVSIPMRGMISPTDNQVSGALKVMNDPDAGPVFVHCRRGADRTGVVVACYRISHQGWNLSDALNEAREDGMSPFEVALRRYVVRFAASWKPALPVVPLASVTQ
jgi:protein tyrosine/serine phosphatase